MGGKFYGWIGKTKKHVKQPGNSGTKTAKSIMGCLEKLGARLAYITGVQTKNLYEMNGKYYYILSIGKGTTWAPYPFIDELEPLYFILSKDNNENEILLYSFKYVNMELKLIDRETGTGNSYYSLSKNIVEEQIRNQKNAFTQNVSLDEQNLKTALEGILNNE